VKPVSSAADGFAGIAARSTTSTSFDRLVLFGDRTELQSVRGGQVTVLASNRVVVPTGAWATLRLEESGGTVRALVDGTVVGQGTGQSATGRIVLQTYHATASFDTVTVDDSAVPQPSATASPPPSAPSPSGSAPSGGELVVAPTGDDSAPGTVDRPLRTVQHAIDLAQPGTTISLRAGTYAPTTNLQITRSGRAGAPITLQSYRGERVLLDGEQLPNTPAPLNGSLPNAERGVIHIEQASYWRVVGLEIANGPYGVYCRDCNNNTFERLVVRDNYETGLQIQGASSNNQVINVDAHGNRDPRKNGESADGLAIKEGSGTGNLVRGVRLWNNVDDGFDAWEFLSPITIESSVAWGNGVNRWNFPNFAGDGNGWKLGGGDEDLPAGHIVRNTIAFDNAQGGFIDNANPGAMVLDRNTAWRNGGTGFDLADSRSTLTRNLSVGNGTQVSLGSSTGSGNSWDLGGTWTFTSTDSSVITGPRTATGAIASSSFLRPANGADVGARI
jgi:parallel beta-helix repeat protein